MTVSGLNFSTSPRQTEQVGFCLTGVGDVGGDGGDGDTRFSIGFPVNKVSSFGIEIIGKHRLIQLSKMPSDLIRY